MNVIVLLCNKQIIQNCEETAVYGRVKSIPFHQLLFVKAVLTDVLREQLNYSAVELTVNRYITVKIKVTLEQTTKTQKGVDV
jgi:hypothetical protein